MTSFELIRVVDETQTELKSLQEFVDYLLGLWRVTEKMETTLAVVLKHNAGTGEFNNSYNQMRQDIATAVTRTREMKSSQLYSDLGRLDRAIDRLFSSLKGEPETFRKIMFSQIDDFRTKYDVFLDGRQIPEAFSMLQSARRLSVSLDTLTGLLSLIRNNLRQNVPNQSPESSLKIFIDSPQTLAEISRKANDFEIIYAELCMVTGISVTEFPLQLVKLETGSFWLELSGNPLVVSIFSALVGSAATYFHQRYTHQGKVESLPKDVTAAEAVLGLRDKLKERGIDTQPIDEALAKATHTIARRLDDALKFEPSVEVQGQKYQIGDAEARKNLSERKMLELTSGSSAEE